MKPFWSQLAEHLREGHPAFVAIVTDHTRHSPGTRGARMFVRPDGTQVGTIGGGGMEADYLRLAADVLAGQEDSFGLETLHHRKDAEGRQSGLICAGKQQVFYFEARPSSAEVFEEFARCVEEDRDRCLTVMNTVPEIIDPPLGIEHGPRTLRVEREGPSYFERSRSFFRVAIFGGGHCGLALSRTMRQLGYRVTVVEERPDVFTLEENRWAHRKLIVNDYVEAGPQIRSPELTHLVVMTAAMPSDVRALAGAIERPFPYKGVMGSEAKLKAIRERLINRGIEPVLIDELYAPIGLGMTSNTPEEIAISVSAQILKEREALFPWSRPSPS